MARLSVGRGTWASGWPRLPCKRRRSRLLALGMLLFGWKVPPAVAQVAPSNLPLIRVKLYETGVGYFERRGRLSEQSELPVPTAHLDDALSTLVVWNQSGEARFDGLTFPSAVTEKRRRVLAGLATQDETEFGFASIIRGLRGEHVAIESDGVTHRGSILALLEPAQSGLHLCSAERASGVEPDASDSNCLSAGEQVVVFVSDRAEIRRLRTSRIESVRPLEASAAERARSAGGRGGNAPSSLGFLGGTGEPVHLGYVTETPLWRSTYRAVLDPKNRERARVQAWALVHNDTDEDWRGVRLELVSGHPDSFLFPMAAPRYDPRRLVTPTRWLPSVPQLAQGGADDLWRPGSASASGEGLGLGGIGEFGGGRGEGIGLGELSHPLEVGDLAAVRSATSHHRGALFQYTLSENLDLAARHSALLPLFDHQLPAVRSTVFQAGGGDGVRVLQVTNTSQQTFPQGTLALFAQETFLGESMLPRLDPGQKKRAVFGRDLQVELVVGRHRRTEVTKRLAARPRREGTGVILTRYHWVEVSTNYRIINRSQEPRDVQISFTLPVNSEVLGGDQVQWDDEDGQVLAGFAVEPGQERQADITTRSAEQEAIPDPSLAQLRELVRAPEISSQQRATLARAIELFEQVEQTENRLHRLAERHSELAGRSQRLRTTLESLARASSPKAKEVAERLVSLEARLARLEGERARLDAQAARRQAVAALLRL